MHCSVLYYNIIQCTVNGHHSQCTMYNVHPSRWCTNESIYIYIIWYVNMAISVCCVESDFYI